MFVDVKSVALIAIARTFVIGAAVQKRVSYTLFASFKNLGMAAAFSLMLFGPNAGIPAAVCILAETSFYILFAALHRHGSLI